MTIPPLANLEAVRKDSVHSNTGVSYTQFRAQLAPNYRRVAIEIALGWAGLILVGAVLTFLSPKNPLSIALETLVGGAAIGLIISYIHLFYHEATHYLLSPSRRRNDKIANIFMGPLLLSCIEFYRQIHMAHHTYLGTSADTENSYQQELTLGYLIRSLCGERVVSVLLNRSQTPSVNISAEVRKKNRAFFLLGAALHFSTLGLGLYFGAYVFAASWFLGVFCFTPFFGALRQLLEHRTDPIQKASRVFRRSIFASIFGAAGFRSHALHHWDPSLSYTCFEEVEAFLLTTHLRDDLVESTQSYFSVFKEIFLHDTQKRHPLVPQLRQPRNRSLGKSH